MQDLVSPLNKNQIFHFTCSPRVSCFNDCCRDLNQVLTPYDVLCLKQFLKLSSSDFLMRYTEAGVGPGTGLPVVSLRFGDARDLTCPFVTDAGCRVYPARPASCRTYPLARGVARHRQTGLLTEHWALIRECHCRGFDDGEPQTVDKWVADQQIAVHQRINDRLLDLIGLKNRFRPGPLKPLDMRRVYTALYDLDTFRDELFTGHAPPVTDAGMLDRARTDDLDLLLVAMDWLGQNIFTAAREKA